MTAWHPILSGVVGSTAYGLAGPGSDVDRLGFAAAPTRQFLGLHPPIGKAATRDSHNPDVVTHEIGKAVALLLRANPTVSELLWLDHYETVTWWGNELIDLRRRFLSARAVRNAYLGYADAQFQRLRNRGRFPDVPTNRVRKHARHLWRLVHQGRDLYLTGHMTVLLAEPELCKAFADHVTDEPETGIDAAERLLAATAEEMDSETSALPDEPDERAAEAWLIKTRAAFYDEPEEP